MITTAAFALVACGGAPKVSYCDAVQNANAALREFGHVAEEFGEQSEPSDDAMDADLRAMTALRDESKTAESLAPEVLKDDWQDVSAYADFYVSRAQAYLDTGQTEFDVEDAGPTDENLLPAVEAIDADSQERCGAGFIKDEP